MGDLREKLQLRDGAESLSYFSPPSCLFLARIDALIVDLQSAGAPAPCVLFVSPLIFQHSKFILWKSECRHLSTKQTQAVGAG
jgi:hypothetical protein